jgi:acetyl-CoA acetyltransferase
VSHPFADVAIAGVYNGPQARRRHGHTSFTVCLEAVRGLIESTALPVTDIDGLFGVQASEITYALGIGPAWADEQHGKQSSILEAASLISTGLLKAVVVVQGRANVYTDKAAVAPWTRPDNEFTIPFGMYTAAEFALIARRHMEVYGTTPEQLATVAATIRNNGHNNPEAIYFGRGPYTTEDILESRMVADPFHLLDCATTSEGACAILLTRLDQARDLNCKPVFILGGGCNVFGPPYKYPPSWDLIGRSGENNGRVGSTAARDAFAMAGLSAADVDCAELYDPFSFEVIRQLEAFGFCAPGEGGPFVSDGQIGPDGSLPITTDGGTMSYSHGGGQLLQRVARGVLQLTGACRSCQVSGAEVVLASEGGAGGLTNSVMILGSEQP